MASFEGLLSLADAALMWGKEESTLRRAVQTDKFIWGEDCKKFGKQWVFTVEAMKKVYGEPKYQYVSCATCRWHDGRKCVNKMRIMGYNGSAEYCENWREKVHDTVNNKLTISRIKSELGNLPEEVN